MFCPLVVQTIAVFFGLSGSERAVRAVLGGRGTTRCALPNRLTRSRQVRRLRPRTSAHVIPLVAVAEPRCEADGVVAAPKPSGARPFSARVVAATPKQQRLSSRCAVAVARREGAVVETTPVVASVRVVRRATVVRPPLTAYKGARVWTAARRVRTTPPLAVAIASPPPCGRAVLISLSMGRVASADRSKQGCSAKTAKLLRRAAVLRRERASKLSATSDRRVQVLVGVAELSPFGALQVCVQGVQIARARLVPQITAHIVFWVNLLFYLRRTFGESPTGLYVLGSTVANYGGKW